MCCTADCRTVSTALTVAPCWCVCAGRTRSQRSTSTRAARETAARRRRRARAATHRLQPKRHRAPGGDVGQQQQALRMAHDSRIAPVLHPPMLVPKLQVPAVCGLQQLLLCRLVPKLLLSSAGLWPQLCCLIVVIACAFLLACGACADSVRVDGTHP